MSIQQKRQKTKTECEALIPATRTKINHDSMENKRYTLCQMQKKNIYLQSMKENRTLVYIVIIKMYCDND